MKRIATPIVVLLFLTTATHLFSQPFTAPTFSQPTFFYCDGDELVFGLNGLPNPNTVGNMDGSLEVQIEWQTGNTCLGTSVLTGSITTTITSTSAIFSTAVFLNTSYTLDFLRIKVSYADPFGTEGGPWLIPAQNGSQCSQIGVFANPNGTLSALSPSTICEGDNVNVVFTATAGTGPFNVTVNGKNFNGISSGAKLSLTHGVDFTDDPSTLQLTSITATNGGAHNCTTTGSPIHSIAGPTVNNIDPGSVTPAAATICAGTSTTINNVLGAAIDGDGPTYSWEVSQDINFGTSSNYFINTPGLSTGDLVNNTNANITYYFRRRVTTVLNGVSCTQTTTPVGVTVTPLPTASATPPSETICDNLVPSVVINSTLADGYNFTALLTSGAATGFTASGSRTIGDGLETAMINNTGTTDAIVTYTVTPYSFGVNALDDNGTGDDCIGTPFDVVVTVQPSPYGLAYAAASPVYDDGVAIASNSPTFTGLPPYAFTVSPALPTGLSIDPSTGVISGTPTAAAWPAAYTVTLADACGTTTTVLNITVNPVPYTGGECVLLDETFDVNPILSSTNSEGAWYPDRYRPHVFSSEGSRLRIGISASDGAQLRPGPFSGGFYNTQGRKINQCGKCVTVLQGDLYIPADWATKKRRSDMWATAYNVSDAIATYLIIGFSNIDGASPTLRYWDGAAWVNLATPIVYDSWTSFEMALIGTNVQYKVNGTTVGTVPALGAAYVGDAILQAFNFNDNTLGASYDPSPNNNYSAFWDNIISTGAGGNIVTNTNTGETFCSLQSAIDDAETLAGHVLEVGSGTYNEQVLVTKGVTINGVGLTKPIVNFTGTVTGKPTLFDVSSNNVTIENLQFEVDLSKLSSAIIASASGLDNITVRDNLITAYGTPPPNVAPNIRYADRNAVSVNYGGFINYRVATGGVNAVSFTGNTVTGTGAVSYFRSGIALDEGGLTATGNTFTTINHDVLVRFAGNGAVNISNNNFNGGGVEFADQNASSTISLNNNTFTGAGAPGTAMLRVKNNYNGIAHSITNNTFNNFEWAVSLENMNNVTLDDNVFSATSATARAVVVNTKSISSNSNTIVQVPIAATLTNNIFNGNGTALTFQNHDSDNDSYGTITIGSAGNENSFASTLTNFIFFDNQTGSSNGSTFPVYPNTGGWPTTMECWNTDLDVQYNSFDVGSGLQLPSAMSYAGRTTLETKLFHDPDASCTGLLTYFLPVHNLTQNTYYQTIGAGISAAAPNDVIELSEWTFNERVIIDKPLTLQGVDSINCVINGTGLVGNGNGITINNAVTNVTITKLTVQNFAGASGNANGGIYAIGGNNALVVNRVAILNNLGGSGFYANGPVNGVTITNVTSTGHTTGARGIVIWNGLKENINISNCHVYGNNCCGIELQDGSATGVTMNNNNVHDNGDNGIGVVGLTGPGANTVSNNTVTNNGRFGIEIKNPNGNGMNSGAGSILVNNNTVTRSIPIVDARDIAGIAVFRRGVIAPNVDVPFGAYVSNNTVSGYTQPSNSDGFGIVVEGINHTIENNNVSGCDVGIQRQAGHLPYPGDGDQSNLSDTYFGRGNSPYSCGITLLGNTTGSNTVPTRDVGTVAGVGYVTNGTSLERFCTIQAAIDDASTLAGHILTATAATYTEDVTVSKAVTLQGAGYATTTISGPIGGGGSTVKVSAAGAVIDGFTITRDGNNLTDWGNASLNSAGVSIQGQTVWGEIRNCNFYGNRTAIDVNNSNGNNIHNNIIDFNRTGLLFRNQTDNTNLTENTITNNWTVGVLFLDASGGSNSPVQSALNSNFNDNNISGNWYGEVVDRQSGGSLPLPGTTNLKDFECNWYGAATYPAISIANSAEPGYGALIPVAFGGTATPPGGQPDILGAASSNIDFISWQVDGTDDQPATIGFQPVAGACVGAPVLITSVVVDDILCGEPSGSITVDFAGGTTPHDIAWTGGSASMVTSPYVISGLAAGPYSITVTSANGSTATASATVQYLPVTNTNDGLHFATIQQAIDAGTTGTGEIISVCAGTYVENITVNKSVVLNGPNSAISPNGGARVAEAIIVPPSSNTASGRVVLITASGVNFKGFTVNGDNASLAESGVGFGAPSNSSIDALHAISVNANGLQNIIVAYNIVQNVAGTGIRMEQTTSYSGSGPAATYAYHNTIHNNLVDNVMGSGISIRNNMYADVYNNVVTNSLYGLTVTTMRIENKAASAYRVISGNSFQARQAGIWFNLCSATPYEVNNNNITAYGDPTQLQWNGIMMATVSGAQNFMSQTNLPQVAVPEFYSFNNNNINGSGLNPATVGNGYWLYYVDNFRDNLGVDHFATITGGSVSNVDRGVFMMNFATEAPFNFSNPGTTSLGAHANISGVNISVKPGGTGIFLKDNAGWTTGILTPLTAKRNVYLNLGSGMTVSGGEKGLLLDFPPVSTPFFTPYDALTSSTINNLAFMGQTDNYIELLQYSRNLNGLTATFNGQTGTTASLAQNFAIEDKVQHSMDNTGLGFVTWKTNNDFVTTTTLGVQRGVDVASSGWTVNIADGTYLEDVNVNKTNLLLDGQSRAGAILKGLYAAGGVATLKFANTSADGSTAKNLTITRDYQDWYGSTKNYGVLLSGGVNDITLDNLLVTGNRNGVYVENNGELNMVNSIVEENRTGLHITNTVRGNLTNNILRNNQTHGIFYNLDDVTSNLTGYSMSDNSIYGNWYSQATFRGANSLGTPADFECNYWGTDAPTVNATDPGELGYALLVPQQLGGTSAQATYSGTFRGNGAVFIDYTSWRTGESGNMSDPFAPTGLCEGTPVEIVSAIPNSSTFCTANGSIAVDFTGGTGPYTISWNGAASGGPVPVTSVHTINMLPAGMYGVTVTDANGSTATASVNIENLPVRNTNTSSYYATIQAAINAATAGDVIDVCAGTYTENININKPLVINGPNLGIAGTGMRVAEAILLNCSIDINNSGATVIDGFHILRNDATAIDQIQLDGAGTNVVQNCIFERNGAGAGVGARALTTSAGGGAKIIADNKITGDVSGGLFGGHKTWNTGIYVNGGAATVNITGNTFMNSRTAFNIDDITNSINIAGNTLNNNGTHISLGGTVPPTGNHTLGANDFINNAASTMVNLSNVAESFRFNITSSSLNGTPFSTLGNAALFEIEARMAHKEVTASKKGKVIFKLGNQYVNNFTSPITKIDKIQNSIKYGDANDIINLEDGTYNEKLIVDKSNLTLQGVTNEKTLYIIDGTGLGVTSGIFLNSGVTNTTIKDLTVQKFTGANGNANAGIYGSALNNNLTVTNVALLDNPTASGFYANGPIDNVSVTNSMVTNNGGDARGIVIWNGLKTHITITGNTVTNNRCCGIELQDGDASAVNVSNNTIDIQNGDNAIGLVGLNPSVGANTVDNNTIIGGGRFGIEIKNPAGGVTVNNNSVTLSTQNSDVRDRAGIAILRRSVSGGNIDVPNGVTITMNTVTGYQQTSTSEGFGIVVEGTNHVVTGNTVNNCEVGILQQQNPSGYPGDANQNDVADQYFGRGNSPWTCGNTISGNTFSGNGLDTRNIGVGFGLVTNVNSGEYFCSIQTAINDAQTANGHIINVSDKTFTENVTINKGVTINGANVGTSGCDTRVAESVLQGRFEIVANNISIDGFELTGTGAQIRSSAGSTTWSGISIQNNYIHATTASQAILHAFGQGGGVGTTNWTVSNNKIEDIQAANATAMALFNISNATINDNCIAHANAAFTGRRGINADGLQNSSVNGNTINMGDASPTTTTNAPWAIQVSMSDRAVTGLTINENTISNAYRAIQGLSQRNITGLEIHQNVVNPASLGVDLNTGGVAPVSPVVMSQISIKNNTFTTVTPTVVGALGASVRLRNLHSGIGVSFDQVEINENSFNDPPTNDAIIFEAGLSTTNTDASCNWYNTAIGAEIASKINGSVPYTPWLTSGGDGPGMGFQPTGLCEGTPVVITSVVVDDIICGEPDGSVALEFMDGTSPYDIDWGVGSITGVVSPYTITGLAAGPYTITVTSTNGSTATASATVQYLPVTNITDGLHFATIQQAINAPTTGNGETLEVCSGTYNEQVLVNKGVTIKGVGVTRPTVNFTGTVTGKPTLFDVSVDGATIENIHFNVDLSKLKSAIIVSGAGIDNITVNDNVIDAYGTPSSGTYSDRNAVSINYGGSTNYRVATGGVNNVIFTDNTVNGSAPDSYFRSGISLDEGGGTITGNMLTSINHDVLVRFANNGALAISGNYLNGGGIELSDLNAGAGTIDLSTNTFTGTGAPGTAVLRLKNNYNGIPHSITNNTFNSHEWAVSLENMNNVTLDNNTFNSSSPTAHAVVVNTKSISTNSNSIVQVPIGATFTNNDFNGTGTALTFLNHDSDNDSYGTFTLGTAGNENNFSATASSFIVFDNQTGPSNGSTFPNYDLLVGAGAGAITTKACWEQDLAADFNNFDVGNGLQLPTAMTETDRNALETKLTHTPDDACLGRIRYFYPVHNVTQNTYHALIQDAIDAPTTLEGDVIEVPAGTYAENIVINKSVILNGPNANIDPCSVTPRNPEAILTTPIADIGFSSIIYINPNTSNVSIKGFTIDGDNTLLTSGFTSTNGADIDAAEGISAYESGVNNLTVSNNIIQNLSYFGVTLYDYPAAVPSSGHVISNNLIRDLGTYDASSGVDYWGGGVLIYNNQYAAITDNCMENVRLGVQTGNFYQANPGAPASQVISGNSIQARRVGIFHNLHYSNASPITLSDNTITGLNDVNESGVRGILLGSLSVGSTTQGNNIDLTGITTNSTGIEVWNVKNTAPAAISGGSVMGVNTGLFLNNFEGYSDDAGDGSHATVTNLTIAPNASGTGIRVLDSPSSTSHAAVSLDINAGVVVNGGSTGLSVENPSASISGGSLDNLALNATSGIYVQLVSNTGNLDGTAVAFDGLDGTTMSLPQLFDVEDKIWHKIDDKALGFVTVKSDNSYVTDMATTTATNNDYTRIRNAVELSGNNRTINLKGTFDWTETNAAASWALGNDELASTGDDYGITIPANLNGVTFTAPEGLGTATIHGPGDLPTANLEGVLYFDATGDNQGWTMSNIIYDDFDMPIGMFFGAGGTDAYNNTTITNNTFNIATDLNVVDAPADPNQNIGIHFAFGTNQTISNNTFNVPGNGVSNGTNFSTTAVMQSNTSGGAVYDGLQITGNTINVLNAQSASPEVILGIWENGHAHTSNINISNNQFLNLAVGNNPTLNLQRAFRVTSHSGASSTVTYSGNTSQGANIGFQWLAGQNFGANMPIAMTGNILNGNDIGMLVQSNGKATLSNNNFDNATDNARDVRVQLGSVVSSTGGNSFAGDTYYIENLSATSINVEMDNFDESDNFDRSDKLYDALDANTSGLVVFEAQNHYVSKPGTGSADETIARAILAAAASGDVVHIEAGSFPEGLDATGKDISFAPASSGTGCVTLTGNMVLNTSDAINAELGGTTPCTEHDQFTVNGTVTIGGANLVATLSYSPTAGDEITLIQNDGTDAVMGQFAQGSTVIISGIVFGIEYEGGDGNDVVLIPCGSGNVHNGMDNYCSIQAAIDAASPTDIIEVDAGTYTENIIINKAVTLKGANFGENGCSPRAPESTIAGGVGTAVTIAANGVILDGFEITGATAVALNGYTNIAIANNKITADAIGVNAAAIATSAGNSLNIEDNCIDLTSQVVGGTNTTVGILVNVASGTAAIVVDGNTITNAFYGHLFYGVNTAPATTVSNGTVTGVMQGLAVVNSIGGPLLPSNLVVSDMDMSDFAGAHPSLPAQNFQAGIYTFTAAPTTPANGITLAVSTSTIDGTQTVTQASGGIALADFSSGAVTVQNVTVDECTIINNDNRGLDARGRVDVTLTESTFADNGAAAFGTGGNDGFTILAQRGATIVATNNFVTLPSSSTTNVVGFQTGNTPANTITAHDNSVLVNGNAVGKAFVNTSGNTIDATCNWLGSTVPSTNAPLVAGTLTYIPWLHVGTDASGAAGFQPAVTCAAPCDLDIAASKTDVTCFGANDGTATVNITDGGVSPYAYLWSNAETTVSISMLEPGTYTVTVTDINGCTNVASVTIVEPSAPLAADYAYSNVSCLGANNGAIFITMPSGGYGTYEYSINGGMTWQTSGTYSNLPNGTYNVQIRDAAQPTCFLILDAALVISQPAAALAVSSVQNTVTCNGDNDGAINLTVTGGTPTYYFAWNNLEITEDLSGLTAGLYNVLVTDANGCTVTHHVTIAEASPIMLSETHIDADCFGDNNGSIDLTVSGGGVNLPAAPVGMDGVIGAEWTGASVRTVNYNPSAPVGNFGSPTGENHVVAYEVYTRQDANYLYVACTTNSALGGSPNASVQFANIYFGGNTSVGFELGTGATNAFRPGFAGSQPVTSLVGTQHEVFTSNNFSGPEYVTELAVPLVFFKDDPLSLGITTINGSAGQSFVRISLTQAFGYSVAGGQATYGTNRLGHFSIPNNIIDGGYAYNWSNGPTTEDITGLSADTYSVIVTDDLGCTATTSIIIDEPDQATLTSVVPSAADVCMGTAVSFTANGLLDGVNEINYTVTGPGGPFTGTQTLTVAGGTYTFPAAVYPVGTYNITINSIAIDGCTTVISSGNTASFTVNPNPTLATVTAEPVCEGNSTNIVLSGLLPNVAGVATYTVGGGPAQMQAGTADGSGNFSFPTPVLSLAENGLVIEVTKLTVDGTLCETAFTGMTVTLAVNPNPTLGTVTAAPVCEGNSTNIVLTGLLPNVAGVATYTVGGGPELTQAGTADALGNFSFPTPVLSLAENGLVIEVTKLTVDGTLCETTFTGKTVTLVVNANTGPTSFTGGAAIVCQDAANETYVAIAANSTSILYSVSPMAAGTINPSTGEMDWDAGFYGMATISATSTGLCGTTSEDLEVTVNPLPTGTLTAVSPVCYNDVPQLTFNAGLGAGPFDLVINGDTYSSITSGAPFPANAPISATTVYNLTVITDDETCSSTAMPISTVTVEIEMTDPVITSCPVTRTLEGCGTEAVSGPAFSLALASSSYAEFSDATNLGVASDDCSIATVQYKDVASSTCPIVVTRTWTLRDAANNEITCDQIINIDDTTDPVVSGTLDAITVEGCGLGAVPSAVNSVAQLEALAGGVAITDCHDDVDLVVTHNDVSNGTCPIVITRTYTVTDPCGEFSTLVQTINVDDSTAPTVQSTDFPGVPEDSPDVDNYACGAVINRTTDPGGCIVPLTITKPTWTDLCDMSINRTQVTNNGTTLSNFPGIPGYVSGNFPAGETIVTFRGTDDCGNIGTCSITINVTDNIAPTVVGCTSNQTAVTAPGQCSAIVTMSAPLFSDNCTVASVTYSATGATPFTGAGLLSSRSFNAGVTTVQYTVMDAAGNSNTSCSFMVTVTDNQAPAITCPAPVTVNANNAGCTATGVSLGTPVVTDNCSPTVTNNAPMTFPLGMTTVVWTATDVHGLGTASCNQVVTVVSSATASIDIAETSGTTVDDGTICLGDVATLTATAGTMHLWSPTTNLFTDMAATIPYTDQNLATVYAKPNANTTYTVITTSVLGCTASASSAVTVIDCSVAFQTKLFISHVSGGIMDDYLGSNALIPLSDPYDDAALPYEVSGNFIHEPVPSSPATTTQTILDDNNVVDWIFVELRTGTSGATTVVASKSGLLKNDGTVINPDGTPFSFSGVAAGNYFVAIKHRNHVGFMTDGTVALPTASLLNLTDGSVTLYEPNHAALNEIAPGVFAMWTGDANVDTTIDGGDVTLARSLSGSIVEEYHQADVNLDGSVDGGDVTSIRLNSGLIGQQID